MAVTPLLGGVNAWVTSAYAAEGDAPAAPKAVAVHKTIDALGDGGDNPDTTLRGEDYYRLNLDINGPVTPGTDKPAKEKENIDVVFCLDFSASMDSAMSSSEETKRYQAMANIMGSDVVSSILQDPKNNVSVVGFWGNSAMDPWDNVFRGYRKLTHSFTNCPQNPNIDPLFSDAGTLCGWTNNASDISNLRNEITDKFTSLNSSQYVDGYIRDENDKLVKISRLRYMQGTNYTAGLREVLAKLDEKKNDGNKKVLVFLSDGVPTFYLPDMTATPSENTAIPGDASMPGSPLVDRRWGDGTESDRELVDDTGPMKTYQYPWNMATSMQGTLNVWNGSYANELGATKRALEASQYANNGQLGAIYQSGSGQFQQKLRDMGVNLTTYTIGISDEFTTSGDSDAGYGQGSPYVLKQMAGTTSDCNTAGKYFSAQDSSDLTAALQEIMQSSGGSSSGGSTAAKAVDNVSITDNLSAYVRLYQAQPDFKVIMQELDADGKVKAGGDTKVLWSGNEVTTDGRGIIKSVSFTASSANDSTGTVTVTFNPTYQLDKNYRYTLSYNVQATNAAYQEFAANKTADSNSTGYSSTVGEAGTDYAASGNKTSAGRPGFFSNESATATYKADGTDQSATYPKPVIQVGATKLQVTKVWQDEDGNELAADEHPDSVTVTLKQDGTATNNTLTLSAENNWTGTFDNLVPKKLKKDGSYESIIYAVEESTVDGYDTTVTYANTADPQKQSFYVGDGQIVVSENTVTHVYGNGDASATVTNKKRPRRFGLTITKSGRSADVSDDSASPLAGASFTVTSTDGAQTSYYASDGNASTSVVKLTTGDDGKISVTGLLAGTYTITETDAPAGYQKPTGSMTLVINKDGTAAFTSITGAQSNITADGNGVFSIAMTDLKQPDMPGTGGAYALILQVVGVAALAAGVVVIGRRIRAGKDG